MKIAVEFLAYVDPSYLLWLQQSDPHFPLLFLVIAVLTASFPLLYQSCPHLLPLKKDLREDWTTFTLASTPEVLFLLLAPQPQRDEGFITSKHYKAKERGYPHPFSNDRLILFKIFILGQLVWGIGKRASLRSLVNLGAI